MSAAILHMFVICVTPETKTKTIIDILQKPNEYLSKVLNYLLLHLYLRPFLTCCRAPVVCHEFNTNVSIDIHIAAVLLLCNFY